MIKFYITIEFIMSKPINFILSMDKNNVIGINNTLPWHIKEELKYFKQKTCLEHPIMSQMVIMGYKTFESMGNKALSNRLNIILTSKHEKLKNQENLIFLSNLSNALYYGNLLPTITQIWIIGGLSLYEKIDII